MGAVFQDGSQCFLSPGVTSLYTILPQIRDGLCGQYNVTGVIVWLLRLGYKIRRLAVFSLLSGLAYCEGYQAPYCEDMGAALWRGLWVEEPSPPASSRQQLVSNVSLFGSRSSFPEKLADAQPTPGCYDIRDPKSETCSQAFLEFLTQGNCEVQPMFNVVLSL